jgi:alkanesulfonate monooxygenase SsuD/methylene tetrahydromethanopterin reductase-like flavin-dependent oxidoreductase (luciferase family)
MPVEFVGMISTQQQSEIHPRSGPVVDRAYVRACARAHEDAGFNKVLIGYSAARPDGLQVAAYAAAHTERLHFLVAHRPGFVFPTVAARSFATLDQFTEGRVALHTITGGNDAEQRRDGDFLSKDARYARTDEYLEIIKPGPRQSRSASRANTSALKTSRPRSGPSNSRVFRFTSGAPRRPRTASAPSMRMCMPRGASRWRKLLAR